MIVVGDNLHVIIFRSVRSSMCKNFGSFSFSFFSSFCPVTPGHPCHPGGCCCFFFPGEGMILIKTSKIKKKSESDDEDHGDHGGNDDNDLFTSHDQQEKEGADRGLQFPT